MNALIDASLVIGLANNELEKFEEEPLNKLLRLTKSDNFALEICLNSVNKKEILDPENKALMNLLEYIKEVDSRGCIGSSTIGTVPIGGYNTERELQEFIDEFTNNYSSNPQKLRSNENDAIQCHLVKMLDAKCFLTGDCKTIIDRHGDFLEARGVKVLLPSQFYQELLSTFSDLDSYM